MKSTLFKDARRNIRRQFVSFISIVIVIALGVGIYLACSAGANAVGKTADEYYADRNYHDLEIRSTLGMTEEDISALTALETVKDAEGVFAMEMLTGGPAGQIPVRVVTKTEKFDRFDVKEGRAPESAGECVIVTALSESAGIGIGNTISLRAKTAGTEFLKQTELTVVGLILHPDHFRVGEAVTPDVVVPKDAVDTKALGVPFTGAFIKLNTDAGSFSEEYADFSVKAAREIAVLGEERSKLRGESVAVIIDRKLAEAKEKILALLSDPATSADTLKQLAGFFWEAIREQTVRLPVIGSVTLDRLVGAVADKTGADLPETGTGAFDTENISRMFNLQGALSALKARWIVLPREANLSYGGMRDSIRMFGSIGSTFALLFVILGALVCYATIGKIVDEQKRLIGATKALGLYKKEIFSKYLLFGGLGSLLGGVSGAALSYFLLEEMLIDATAKTFEIDSFAKVFEWIPATVAILGALAVGTAATWLACRKLLSKPATQLLSGETPVTKKKKESRERGGRKPRSIYAGLIVRNIRSDIKRVIITVVSVAGCCMLLVTGFALKFTFGNVIDEQFGGIIRYDGLLEYLPEDSKTVEGDIEKVLDGAGCTYTKIYYSGTLARIGDAHETVQVFACDPDALPTFYRLCDNEKKTERRISDGGVAITSGIADHYALSVGDHLSILDAQGVYRDVTVSEVYKNYAGKGVFLSRDYAAAVFGDARTNAFLVKNGNETSEEMAKKLKNVKGFVSITDSFELRGKYRPVVESLDKVVILMTVMAAIMAAVVLLNLVKIQINQKKRELTIMRVNGFTLRETVAYVLRENIITTVLGILLGAGMGCLTAYNAIVSLERAELQLIRTPNLPALAISAAITLLFAAIVNVIALRKIGKLKLSDVND
ncbi:MAG: ABC transporter permease [Clostridia bacterium]|nr:ABC transporter permease [Clostridia bacterium]